MRRYNPYTNLEVALGFPAWRCGTTNLPSEKANPGRLGPVAADYFSRPFLEQEFVDFPAIDSLYPHGKTTAVFPVPPQLRLSAECQELLAYSNGGVIINGQREFSSFEPEGIWGYYIRYEFPIWASALLPIDLNGGIYYAYDFRLPGIPTLIAVAASDISYDGVHDEVTAYNQRSKSQVVRSSRLPAQGPTSNSLHSCRGLSPSQTQRVTRPR